MHAPLHTSTVRSSDGTPIAVQHLGRGPDLVLVHGALGTAEDLGRLARALAQDFAVHAMTRRGRDPSGPQGARYCLERECEDLAAVQAATGATLLVGHSYGGLVALEASRQHLAFTHLALYEPGVVTARAAASDWDWLDRAEAALAGGDPAGAFAAFVRGAGHSPALDLLPDWVARRLLPWVLGPEQWPRMLALLPSCLAEHRQLRGLPGSLAPYRALLAPVLLLSGDASPPSVQEAMAELQATLPRCQRVCLAGLDHLGPDDHHHPEAVAAQLIPFLRQGVRP
jgi:pimeloyl-ACP methyl ester carboxylesterase